MDGPTDEFPFEFECQRSGNCCSIPGGFVRVTPEESAAIADYLGLSRAGFESRYLTSDGERLAEGPSARCVFLEGGRATACSIYSVRPTKCASWPYWSELQGNRAALERASQLCPGLRLTPEGD